MDEASGVRCGGLPRHQGCEANDTIVGAPDRASIVDRTGLGVNTTAADLTTQRRAVRGIYLYEGSPTGGGAIIECEYFE